MALQPKLQAKLTPLQPDLTATKKELADAKQLSALEEVAENELEEVKEELAVIEVEAEVLRGDERRLRVWLRGPGPWPRVLGALHHLELVIYSPRSLPSGFGGGVLPLKTDISDSTRSEGVREMCDAQPQPGVDVERWPCAFPRVLPGFPPSACLTWWWRYKVK